MKKRVVIRIILIALVLIVGALAVYFSFFYSYECENESCFLAHQEECARTDYVREGDSAIWSYHIAGEKDGRCEVEVELVNLKSGTADKRRLEGKEMTCNIPLGETTSPESDISRCNGELKEEMQNFIIQRLHQYIVENVGEIGAELRGIDDVPSVSNDGVNESE